MNYDKISHSHCFQSENPPCGLKGKHRCCLCKEEVPKETTELYLGAIDTQTEVQKAKNFKLEEVYICEDGLNQEKIKSFLRSQIIKAYEARGEEIKKMIEEEYKIKHSVGYKCALSDLLTSITKN